MHGMDEKETKMSFNITTDTLKNIAGYSSNPTVVNGLVEHLPNVMRQYDINSKQRVAHFLGMLALVSNNFASLEDPNGDLYENRRDLGNVKKGDGNIFKNRGLIKIVGRNEYKRMGDILGLDLENNPQQIGRAHV